MSTLVLEIEEELRHLAPEKARQFEQVLRATLVSFKSQNSSSASSETPLAERLKNHPAIGTWPQNLSAEEHIDSLRSDWEDRA